MDQEKDTLDFSMDDILRQLQEATLENDAMDAAAPETATEEEPAPAFTQEAPEEDVSPVLPEPSVEIEAEEITTLEFPLPEEPVTADALEFAQLAFSQVAQEPSSSPDPLSSTDPLGSFVPTEDFGAEEAAPAAQEEVPPLFAEESPYHSPA